MGAGLGEYLARALSHQAALAEPKDLAWLLASYARDGLSRLEAAGNPASLAALRSALEETLGIRFEGERGERFFRSTLIQTLFYGIFSAWVLWSREEQGKDGPLFEAGHGPRRFRWREAVWHLRAPVLRALFGQLSDPGRLKPLGLVEVLDWTSAALNRVDRAAFFSRFNEGDAVPYFYEPFLEAFDPALRKQLGVWYTPSEVVRYMVARVDKALKDDLGIPEGLAAENVYVLDPCCGTGAYLAEVLRRIALNQEGQGLGALAGEAVRKAATERVFGFEIMPAPFVVAHLQVGLTMQNLDAPLAADGSERAGVFLTNALTGWEPHMNKPLPFPELEEERDRADRVKQDTPILVILGNPPYNGFAGMAVEEERELSEAYRKTKRVRRPEGQGLNDLYVRFFRMAERRIAERTGQGVVCFISNYSWLDGLSFTGMRERYLEAFDAIRIDCLNGDKYKTGKVAPDGSPDPSIFSTEGDPVGIQVGTAIATLVRKADHEPAGSVEFRNLWGQKKPEQLIATAEAETDALYSEIEPVLPLGLPFVETAVSEDWFDWPALPELFPVSFPGVKTSRDGFLVDTDLDRLQARVGEYFDPTLSHREIARRYPRVMKSGARFDARAVREGLLNAGSPMSPDSSALPTGRSTTAGCTGRRIRSCSTRRGPTTGPMRSRGTYGSKPGSVKRRRTSRAGPWLAISRTISGMGCLVGSRFGCVRTVWGLTKIGGAVRTLPTGRRDTSNASERVPRISSTMCLVRCMIPHTARTTLAHCASSGHASRCLDGRTAIPREPPKNSPARLPMGGSSPRFLIPQPRSPVSPGHPCVPRSQRSPSPVPSGDAT